MSGLIQYNGGILYNPDSGGVVYGDGSPECCCIEEGGDCPVCCIELQGGAFSEPDGMYLVQTDTITDYGAPGQDIILQFQIKMPTPNSRIVCQGQTVTVESEVISGAEYVTDGNYFMINWDRLWIGRGKNSEDPFPTDEYPNMIVWYPAGATKVSVNLELNSCHIESASSEQFGDIYQMYSPDGALLPIASAGWTSVNCPVTEPCCPPTYECQRCCALVIGGVIEDDKIVFYSATPTGAVLKVTIDFVDPANRRVCEGDIIQLLIEVLWDSQLGYDQYDGDVCVNHPNWQRQGYTPAVNLDMGGSLTDEEICWGQTGEWRYTLNLQYLCTEGNPGSIGVSGAGGIINIELQQCPKDDDCPCCCPPSCMCDCELIPDAAFCENNIGYNGWIPGGVTQIVDFIWEIDGGDRVRIEQTGQSEISGSCYLLQCLEDPAFDRACANGSLLRVPVHFGGSYYGDGYDGYIQLARNKTSPAFPGECSWVISTGDGVLNNSWGFGGVSRDDCSGWTQSGGQGMTPDQSSDSSFDFTNSNTCDPEAP